MMTLMKIEQLRDVVIGLRPLYTDIGDVTEIITASGDIYQDPRKLKTVRKALARSYGIDLAGQAAMVGRAVKKRGMMPFFIESQRVFIPLKMRRPVASNDAAYGYFDIRYIVNVETIETRRCQVVLSNELRFPVLSRHTTVLGNQQMGQILLLRNRQENDPANEEERVLMESARIIIKTVKGIRIQLNRAGAIEP